MMKQSFLQRMVKDRDEALSAAIMQSDFKPYEKYCKRYGVSIPANEKVRLVSICKAACACTNISDEVKAKAKDILSGIGMSPEIR